MAVVLQPVRSGPGAVPSVIYGEYNTSSSIVQGSVLILTSGVLNAATTNPTAATVVGVALQAKDTAPGFAAANNPSPITGRQTKISYAVADMNQVFTAAFVNGSDTAIAPATTDIGVQYGLRLITTGGIGAGNWAVDKSLTTSNARVVIVGINTELSTVYFKWLQTAINQ